jgi:hypothetical protein
MRLPQELKDQIHEYVMEEAVEEIVLAERRNGAVSEFDHETIKILGPWFKSEMTVTGSISLVNLSRSFWAYTEAVGLLDDQDAFNKATATQALFVSRYTTFRISCGDSAEIDVAWDMFVELKALLGSPSVQHSFRLSVTRWDDDRTATLKAVACFYAKAVEQWTATGRRRGTMLLSQIDLHHFYDPPSNLPLGTLITVERAKMPSVRKLRSLLSRMDNVPADLVSDPAFVVKLWRLIHPRFRKYGNDL